MGLVELLGSTAGDVPQPVPPVVISCDWGTLPTDDRLGAVVELMKVARFQAHFIDAKEAYVVLTNVRDRRTNDELLAELSRAYIKSEPRLRYLLEE